MPSQPTAGGKKVPPASRGVLTAKKVLAEGEVLTKSEFISNINKNFSDKITLNDVKILPGFILAPSAYKYFLASTKLDQIIKSKIKLIAPENAEMAVNLVNDLRDEFMATPIPEEITSEIKHTYHFLCGNKDAPIDIEHMGKFRYKVESWSSIVKTIKEMWTEGLITALTGNTPEEALEFSGEIKIILSPMAEKSGYLFTVNSLTGNKNQISIEAIYGDIQPLREHQLIPDVYLINKEGLKVLTQNVSTQNWQQTLSGKTEISKIYQNRTKLEKAELAKLARIALQTDAELFIEWAIWKNQIYILSIRKLEFNFKKSNNNLASGENLLGSKEPLTIQDILLKGKAAAPGIAIGTVTLAENVLNPKDISSGNIVVFENYARKFSKNINQAGGLITEGKLPKEIIETAEKLGIPLIEKADFAATMLGEGELITIDGFKGKVYAGDQQAKLSIKPYKEYRNHKTATKLFAKIGELAEATMAEIVNADGAGVLKSEFIIAGIGTHPQYFVEKRKQKVFQSQLKTALKLYLSKLPDMKIFYRPTIFGTSQFLKLKHGENYEEADFDLKGLTRYIKFEDTFKMEMQVIKSLRNKDGYRNLSVVLPFAHTADEYVQIKKRLSDIGLTRKGSFELHVEFQAPANIIEIDEFIAAGVDGILLDVDTLLQSYYGTSGGSNIDIGKKQLPFDIKTLTQKDIPITASGRVFIENPALIKQFVRAGISGFVLPPNQILGMRKEIVEAEFSLIKQK